MSKKLCLILLLVFCSCCVLFSSSSNVFAAQLDAEAYFNPTYSSYPNHVTGGVRFIECDNTSFDWQSTWSFTSFGVLNASDLYSAGSGDCEINVLGGQMSLYNYGGSYDSEFASPIKIDTSPLGDLDYYALSTNTWFQTSTGSDIETLTTRYIRLHLNHTLLDSEDRSSFSGTFIIIPTNLTTFDHDWSNDETIEDNGHGSFRIYNNAIYTYRTINSDNNKGFSNLMGSTYSTTIDLQEIALSAPYGGTESIYGAQLAVIFVPNVDLQSNPLQGSWGNTPEEWCEVNAEDTNACLEGWQVRPGISNTDIDKFNFDLFNPFFSPVFTLVDINLSDCVEIPTIARFIKLQDSTICKIYPASVRMTGNYVMGVLSLMLIFGFIISYLRKNEEITF